MIYYQTIKEFIRDRPHMKELYPQSRGYIVTTCMKDGVYFEYKSSQPLNCKHLNETVERAPYHSKPKETQK